MAAPTPTHCEQLLLPFMVSRSRKLLPDLDRVRRHGGAPIELKRAVFKSRRMHRKGKHQQAWDLLMRLPDEFDDYRELIKERLLIASWVQPLDRSPRSRYFTQPKNALPIPSTNSASTGIG